MELLKPAKHVNDHGLRRQDCGPASAKSYKNETKFACSDILLNVQPKLYNIYRKIF